MRSSEADVGPSNDETHIITAGYLPVMVAPVQTIRNSNDLNNYSYAAGDGLSTASTAGLSPPLDVTPLQTVRPSDDVNNYLYGVGSSTAPEKKGRGRPKGSKNVKTPAKKPNTEDPNSKKVLSPRNFDSGITETERETGNHEIVEVVLMRFDAVRRRFCQLNLQKGILTTADANCRTMGVQTNRRRRTGPVPGVEVGDIFYYWGEMCLVGLHKQTVSGIDYMTTNDGEVEPLAVSVVTSGQYNDETENLEWLIYSGYGGTDKNGAPQDQTMERGNLALDTSRRIGNEVRVTRGRGDPNDDTRKVYIYDGLYLVYETYSVIGKSGCKEFKFKMVRKPGQPNSGYANWKLADDLRMHDPIDSRQGFILPDLSFGKEVLRVPLVNEVDENDKTIPEDFEYITSQHYSRVTLDLNIDLQALGFQNFQGQPSFHQSCMCMERNGGELPYHNSILVCRKPLIYECGESCSCPNDCRNRLVQNGLKLHMEVFKTRMCGWGVRSWDPIRAGTFICEFAGVRKTKEEVEEKDNFVFDSSRFYMRFKWNYEPELVCEDVWESVPEVFNLTTQVLISAKEKGNVARFMNHSCKPNVFWQPIESDTYVRIGLFAMKHIPPMTELTYDYGVSSVERIGEDERLYKGNKICLCGSVNCRGSFG
ncbi:PREDICTED: histone-lysine N-methyltransferase, H3 lysine-9 specific SUVH7-like [Camelina sativa]|uniref:Histone-lysine N-methyltransferase, H3 lysine-9 specific SUVH7-like n=1 Tax=Camelina sativa TaxID=90675 RepID=A0ABM0X179_CAMSA|nr:PREDICTED: histone-lysine N-methyltransferase, H3 lysine-9 specific SUVH7-like [Camelina sativa]